MRDQKVGYHWIWIVPLFVIAIPFWYVLRWFGVIGKTYLEMKDER